MGIRWTRFTEYDLECDLCHNYETVYTGDSYQGRVVNSIQTAIYVSDFHKQGNNLICGRCFKQRSKTSPGIAKAMAEQWGGDIRNGDVDGITKWR